MALKKTRRTSGERSYCTRNPFVFRRPWVCTWYVPKLETLDALSTSILWGVLVPSDCDIHLAARDTGETSLSIIVLFHGLCISDCSQFCCSGICSFDG
jgi:hypothetical protein